MPRKLPDLLVYANPWHGPLDHNHRANTAYPWDPKDNPDRVFVGARHRLDEDGELYFEFDQYEGTHGVEMAKLPATTTRDERLAAAQKLVDANPDSLVLRKDHAPVRVPNTLHFLQGLRSHALFAADMATHVTAFGTEAHFVPVEKRCTLSAAHRFEAHKFHFAEDADPKPRPAVGAGKMGMAHAPYEIVAVAGDKTPATVSVPTPRTPAAEAKFAGAAAAALNAEIARKAAPTPTSEVKGQ